MPDPSDTELRDALTAYTDHAPPLSFTYDQVLTAGRRHRRRRRTAAAATALGVAAVLTGVAVLRPSAPNAAPDLVAEPLRALDAAPFCRAASAPPTDPLATPTTVRDPDNGHPVRIPAEPPGHAAARLSCHLARVVPPLLPRFTYQRIDQAPAGTVPLQAYPGRAFDPARPAQTAPPYLTAQAAVTDVFGAGTVGFGALAANESVDEARRECPDDVCTERRGPHGETVFVWDMTSESGYRLIAVQAYLGDTIAMATAGNGVAPVDPTGREEDRVKLVRTRPDPPLTVRRLIDLACDPELDVYRSK